MSSVFVYRRHCHRRPKNIKIVEDAYNMEKIEMFFYGLPDGM